MKINYDVVVDALLGQIVGTGCKLKIFLFAQMMVAIKRYPVQVLMSRVAITSTRIFLKCKK